MVDYLTVCEVSTVRLCNTQWWSQNNYAHQKLSSVIQGSLSEPFHRIIDT